MKTKVNKEDYHVHLFLSGHYGICEQPDGGGCVFGGDPANEDDYSGEYMDDVYQQWDGTLVNGITRYLLLLS